MKIKSAQQLVAEASSRIETVPLDEATAYVDAAAYVEADGVVFVDLRDIRELDRDGMIPGAFHAPRGMLEFWVDPTSPYYKDIFGSGKKFIFYCASGWRSTQRRTSAVVFLAGSMLWAPPAALPGCCWPDS